MEIVIKEVYVAFWHGQQPKKTANGERYSAAFPIVPGSANHKLIVETMKAVSDAKWDKKGPAILAQLIKSGDVMYKEAPASDDEGSVYEGFEEMFTLNAGQAVERGAPLVIDSRRDPKTGKFPELTAKDGRPYSGAVVNVKIDVWAQDNTAEKGGKRMNAQIRTVQFVRDSAAFGGGGPGSDAGFEDVTDGADADELA